MHPARMPTRSPARPGLLVYQQQKDATKGKKLVEFLKWPLTKGETMAKDLDYAALPDSVQQRVLKTDRRNKNVRSFNRVIEMFSGPRVLFICVHNGGRSQMGEAFLKHYAGDRFDARSAGLELGELNPWW